MLVLKLPGTGTVGGVEHEVMAPVWIQERVYVLSELVRFVTAKSRVRPLLFCKACQLAPSGVTLTVAWLAKPLGPNVRVDRTRLKRAMRMQRRATTTSSKEGGQP